MTSDRNGQIITFYSYKGGTGRTMALANVAWILASHGKRVLTVDWDLDSPGLHRFFHPFLDPELFNATSGVIDVLSDFARAATHAGDRPRDWHLRYARVLPHAVSLTGCEFPGEGTLDVISAGRVGRTYATAVSAFKWDNFYDRLGGGVFFDALREDMRRHYDYTLIDSRTGLSDIAGICTVRFPDTVVNCFTLSDQAIDGAAAVTRSIEELRDERRIRVLPVPMRVEDGEQVKLENGRALARTRFAGYPRDLPPEAARRYWGEVEIPYKPFYAYEETLATIGDEPHLTNSLLSAFERLTAAITHDAIREFPPLDEAVRKRHAASFERHRPVTPPDVFLSYAPEDRMWADWIGAVLRSFGFRIVPQGTGFAAGANVRAEVNSVVESAGRTVVLLSPAYVNSSQAKIVWDALTMAESESVRRPLVPIRVADVRLRPPFDAWNPVDLVRLSEAGAREALSRALDKPSTPDPVAGDRNEITARFPGARPPVWSVPARNASFTGRAELLEQLRDRLPLGMAVVLPQALHGLGGVGKTQLALEYAHRFMADYDLVWWIAAEQEELINSAFADIAVELGIRRGENLSEVADAVRDALRRGQPYRRWLLIFDNADTPEDLAPHLPQGNGHVIVTSRNPAWSHVASPLEVNTFTREESVEHLTRRVPGLRGDRADEVAQILGDLPLAVELGGAWLETTGMPVEHYIELLETHMASWLAESQPRNYPATALATWSISIERLREQSPAAARLLELCSCFAPEPISMQLLYSDTAIGYLLPYDPSLQDSRILGRIVREVGRYALIKVDQGRSSIEIHRLVQAVVRDSMSAELLEETQHQVHRILIAGRPRKGDTDDPENWQQYNEIWPHLGPSKASECVEEPTRQLLVERVRYLWKRGEYDDALSHGRRLEQFWTETRSADDRQTLHLRFHIANVLRSQGNYTAAWETDTDILARQSEMFGAEYLHTLMTAGGLAADLRGLGNFTEALDMDRTTYDRFCQLFGEDYEKSLQAANNLAVSLRLVGDCFAAQDLDRQTYELRQVVLGENHPYTLYSAMNLARDLRETGEFAESTRLLRETLVLYQEVLGEDHPDTLAAASSLAVSLRKSGEYEEAHQLSRATLDRYQALYPEDNPGTLACMLNLACDLSALDDTAGALALAERTLTSYQRTLGTDHPYTLVCANNVSIYLHESDRPQEAFDIQNRTLAAFRVTLGENHWYTLSCAINTANTMADIGRLTEAHVLERDTWHRLQKVLGSRHPDTLFSASNLAVTLRMLDRESEAEAIGVQASLGLRQVIGDDHPNVTRVRAGFRINRDLEPQPI